MSNWENDLAKSKKAFLLFVAPRLLRALGGGELLPMEGHPAKLSVEFDRQSGVDLWHLRSEGGVRGVASRVQLGDFRTFTIRSKRTSGATTELEKLRTAISNDLARPHLHVQAYIETWDGPLISWGYCQISDLIAYIDENPTQRRREAEADRNEFVVVSWLELKRAKRRTRWQIGESPMLGAWEV